MRKRNIGIDIDNVIAESYPSYIQKFNEVFQTQVKFDEIFSFYHLENNTPIAKEKVQEFLDIHIHRDEFQIKIPPYEKCKIMIQKWANKGWGIHFVTARPAEIRNVTLQWLKKHGFWVKGATLDLFNVIKFRSDIEFKADAVKKYILDIFIEDNLDIARVLSIPVLLLDRPWNKGNLPKNVKRVKDWSDIESYVNTVGKS